MTEGKRWYTTSCLEIRSVFVAVMAYFRSALCLFFLAFAVTLQILPSSFVGRLVCLVFAQDTFPFAFLDTGGMSLHSLHFLPS